MLALMLLALSAAPDPLADETLVRFSRDPVLRRTSVEVSVGRIAGDPREPARYWLRRTERDGARGRTPSETFTWTDTQRCPAALAVLREAAALETPRPMISGLVEPEGGYLPVVADGALYALTIEGAYDGQIGPTLTVATGPATPLADWVEASLATLEPCWSSRRPDGVGRD
ncbi:hypothetical protein [Caulobacter sp. 17J65-9]|uniref:hypothetical protein n=1 Tax=Caulobacter sp. 17J65-9 TaxID=2709382 RepID=UPI0013CC94DE|nr:hypothetical protein [Caulobacter sp. 17J65-9]NEX94133.1 hypothetical protein [Caulobacter sp. 17J65-9]